MSRVRLEQIIHESGLIRYLQGQTAVQKLTTTVLLQTKNLPNTTEPTCSCDDAPSHCRPSWGSRRRSDLSPRTRSSCRSYQTAAWSLLLLLLPCHHRRRHRHHHPMAWTSYDPVKPRHGPVNHRHSCNNIYNHPHQLHQTRQAVLCENAETN